MRKETLRVSKLCPYAGRASGGVPVQATGTPPEGPPWPWSIILTAHIYIQALQFIPCFRGFLGSLENSDRNAHVTDTVKKFKHECSRWIKMDGMSVSLYIGTIPEWIVTRQNSMSSRVTAGLGGGAEPVSPSGPDASPSASTGAAVLCTFPRISSKDRSGLE